MRAAKVKSERLAFRVDKDMIDQIDEIAEKQDRETSYIIRRWVSQGIERYRKTGKIS